MSGTRPQVMSWLRIISRDDLQLQSGCAFRAESCIVSPLSLNPSASQLQYGPILSQYAGGEDFGFHIEPDRLQESPYALVGLSPLRMLNTWMNLFQRKRFGR